MDKISNTRNVAIAGFVILVASVIYLAFMALGASTYRLGGWTATSKAAFNEAVSEMGAPSFFFEGDGGLAKWSTEKINLSGYPIYKIMIKNEDVQHCCPVAHSDSMTASIKVNAYSPSKLLAILGTSKAFWYDQGRNMLYARCCCLGTVLAHFVFATNILMRDEVLVTQAYSQPQSPLVQELTTLFNSAYLPWKSNDTAAYEKAREELKRKLIDNLGNEKLQYTEVSVCAANTCANILGFDSLNPAIANTAVCSKASVTTLAPQTEGFTGYYTTGIPEDGKMYNLGLPREFKSCAPMPAIKAMGAPKVSIINKN
jgi:hypothetical protein